MQEKKQNIFMNGNRYRIIFLPYGLAPLSISFNNKKTEKFGLDCDSRSFAALFQTSESNFVLWL